jgi:hypothetical protein
MMDPSTGNGFPVSKQALDIQCDSFLDIALRFLQRLSLAVAPRQRRNESYDASFRTPFVEDGVRERLRSDPAHDFIVGV